MGSDGGQGKELDIAEDRQAHWGPSGAAEMGTEAETGMQAETGQGAEMGTTAGAGTEQEDEGQTPTPGPACFSTAFGCVSPPPQER